jgi:hypothetical protein
MQSITISVDLANALRQYLGQRPHDEVRGLINAIEQFAQQSMLDQARAQTAQAETPAPAAQ